LWEKPGRFLSGEPAEHGPLFAVGGDVGEGRVLVLADHSIFINQMMVPADNNNLEFSDRALRWLQGDRPRRSRVLFVEEGEIRTDLEVPLKAGPDLPPGAAVAVVDETLARLEDRDAFNKMLLDWLGGRSLAPGDRLLRRALEALTVVLVAYGVYRVGVRGRFRPDVMVPLLSSELARHTPAAPLLEQRYRAAVAAGNLWETAHALAREWFASLSVPPPAPGTSPPRLAAKGGWWRRLSLGRRFRRLWRLAHDTTPVRVTPRRLRRLLRDLAQLKNALAEGTVKLS
jgi:hypothetical protein